MMQNGLSFLVFNAAQGGTKYTDPLRLDAATIATWTIIHPSSTTTDYSVQVSNLTDEEIRQAITTVDDWTDYTPISTLSLSAAGNNAIEFTACGFKRARLKMVTASGTGTTQVRGCAKG